MLVALAHEISWITKPPPQPSQTATISTDFTQHYQFSFNTPALQNNFKPNFKTCVAQQTSVYQVLLEGCQQHTQYQETSKLYTYSVPCTSQICFPDGPNQRGFDLVELFSFQLCKGSENVDQKVVLKCQFESYELNDSQTQFSVPGITGRLILSQKPTFLIFDDIVIRSGKSFSVSNLVATQVAQSEDTWRSLRTDLNTVLPSYQPGFLDQFERNKIGLKCTTSQILEDRILLSCDLISQTIFELTFDDFKKVSEVEEAEYFTILGQIAKNFNTSLIVVNLILTVEGTKNFNKNIQIYDEDGFQVYERALSTLVSNTLVYEIEFYSQKLKFRVAVEGNVLEIELDGNIKFGQVADLEFCSEKAGYSRDGKRCFTGCVNSSMRVDNRCEMAECAVGLIAYLPLLSCLSEDDYLVATGETFIPDPEYLEQFNCNLPGTAERGTCVCPENFTTVNYVTGNLCNEDAVQEMAKLPLIDSFFSQIVGGGLGDVGLFYVKVVEFLSGISGKWLFMVLPVVLVVLLVVFVGFKVLRLLIMLRRK
ncbi:hypothetical protein SS50377_25932 [Spironucleus salmonicida]|uniref:Uncharacterized protein n=1 Tax=Spironucleus salmonicida TaxID=348837 RepID=A0A9P8LPE9_9EUKA|nr:hypothetical protein SS50377_25932 [Spironucleus salmonicida]